MAKKGKRPDNLTLECEVCHTRNYTTERSVVNTKDRLELKKHCTVCRKHTLHKESK